MTKQSLPAVSDVNKDTLEEFKTADKVVLVAYFAADDKASNETFTSVANGLRDNYLFGATSDAALAKAEGVKQPGLVLYKSFDDGKDVYTEEFDQDAIEKFVKVASTPLIGEVGPETYAGYMAAGIPLAYIFAETQEERDQFAKELKPLAEKHKGVINFATIDAKSFGQHAGNLNLELGKFPAFAIQKTDVNEKYPYSQEKEITEKNIGQFVDDFVAGKAEPSIKSEPIPETQEGPVSVVVAKNYKDVVIDNDKDVLLEFYAPWCGHCKALAPKYEELAALYQSPELSKLVTVAKVDATLNDVPDEIQGFPTIKLFPAGKKDAPVDYSGARTVEDLAQFIKENGSHKAEAAVPKAAADEDDLPEQAAAATESAKEKASDVSEAAKEKAGEATEAAKGKAGDAAQAASEKATDATDAAKATASDAAEAAKATASDAAEAVKDKAGDATESVKSAASKATEAAKSATGGDDEPDIHDEL
jgi:protein disulfide-isomerase A1